METPNSSFWKKAGLFALGAFVLLIIVVVWRYGAQGVMVMFQKIVFYGLILAIIGLVVAVVWWLFKKHELDMIHVHYQRIVSACRASKNAYKQEVYLRSQSDDWATRELGEVIGVCQIVSSSKRVKTNEGLKYTLSVPKGEKYEKMIFLAYRPKGLFNKIFSDLLGNVNVVAGTPEDFSPLSASVIYLNGLTFSPPLYKILFLSHHWERRHFIDETIKENIFRYTLQETLKEIATIVDDAVDASPAHKKKQETQMVQQLPVNIPQGGGGQR